MGKGENAGYQHFLLFPQCFQKPFFPDLYKSGLCGKGLTAIFYINRTIHTYVPPLGSTPLITVIHNVFYQMPWLSHHHSKYPHTLPILNSCMAVTCDKKHPETFIEQWKMNSKIQCMVFEMIKFIWKPFHV